MEHTEDKPTSNRFGFHRWLVIVLLVGNIFAVSAISPVLPAVSIAPEHLSGPYQLPLVGEIYLTNTIVNTLLADLILLIFALLVYRGTRGGTMILEGLAGVMEMLIDAIHSLTESTAGRWARQIFPWVATIILLVLVVNLSKLFPGVESIGILHEVHGEEEGYPTQTLFSLGDLEVTTILPDEPAGVPEEMGEVGEAGAEEAHGYGVIPFIRPASTDLNFTAGLALVSVVVTQIIGLRALGLGYLSKFFDFGGFVNLWRRPKIGAFDLIFPFLDILVGLLELVAEIAKIISFSFRLFGVMFAGTILLFFIGTLVPVFAQTGILLFELMIGPIQALIFGMLTLIFMTIATQGHGDHEEEGAAAH